MKPFSHFTARKTGPAEQERHTDCPVGAKVEPAWEAGTPASKPGRSHGHLPIPSSWAAQLLQDTSGLCPHLVNEGGELVVEGLDLLLLLGLYLPNLGVDLHIEGLQVALVDGHFLDSPRADTRAIATRPTKATSPSKTTNPSITTAHSSNSTNATSITTTITTSIAIDTAAACSLKATSPGATSHADGDALTATQVVEAATAKATCSAPGPTDPSASSSRAGHTAHPAAAAGDHGKANGEALAPSTDGFLANLSVHGERAQRQASDHLAGVAGGMRTEDGDNRGDWSLDTKEFGLEEREASN